MFESVCYIAPQNRSVGWGDGGGFGRAGRGRGVDLPSSTLRSPSPSLTVKEYAKHSLTTRRVSFAETETLAWVVWYRRQGR
jgi:hypothetical protein